MDKMLLSQAAATILWLIVVLAIFFIFMIFVKKAKVFNGKSSKSIRVVGSLSLGNKEKIILAEIGNLQFLLGVTTHKINKLHVFESFGPKNEVQQENSIKSFSEVMASENK